MRNFCRQSKSGAVFSTGLRCDFSIDTGEKQIYADFSGLATTGIRCRPRIADDLGTRRYTAIAR